MSQTTFTRLTCDGDGCSAELGPVPGGAQQTRRTAKRRLGWGVAFNDDGLSIDLCRECRVAHERRALLDRFESQQAARAAGIGSKWA